MPGSIRQRASSGSPFEATIGFSRAVRIGDRIVVSGTAPVEAEGSSTASDAGAHAARCLAIIIAAIEKLGGTASDVVWTRMYLTDAADANRSSERTGRCSATFVQHRRWSL